MIVKLDGLKGDRLKLAEKINLVADACKETVKFSGNDSDSWLHGAISSLSILAKSYELERVEGGNEKNEGKKDDNEILA
ncbi:MULTISPECIES: hypothetical protein [unclassified Sporolactobacillus]|uniref:hypothetical protein n=1 Tax=unclassified Sporolactobacillus TaxID=2628533 RepID=UPI00236745E6|nr:hypothetical protein [Sporolactobacillus sp. CQH2019]MDD9150416.1 hypothetical protein [Sporolactobacillus sp. CQH2019]